MFLNGILFERKVKRSRLRLYRLLLIPLFPQLVQFMHQAVVFTQ